MPKGILDTALGYIASLVTSKIFTPEGQAFAENRTNYVSDQVKAAQSEEKSHFVAPLSRLFAVNVCGLRPSFFTFKSLAGLTSGTDDPAYRSAYKPFQSMFDLSATSPISWVLKQDQKALEDRQKLASYMKGENLNAVREYTARHISERWQALDLTDTSDHCWYQWFHQLVIEVTATQILGISKVPANVGKILDESEEAIIHETPPMRVCGKDISYTASQKKFTKLKAEFREMADELIFDNRNEILTGKGYLNDLLTSVAETSGRSIEDLFDDEDVQVWLRVAAGGLLLAAGTLSATLAVAFLHLDKDMNKRLNASVDHPDGFIDYFFKEALRYTSGGGLSARFISKAKTLTGKDDATVTLPKNTFVFIDLRSTNYDPTLWDKPHTFAPLRHQDEKAPNLDSTEFSPFSLGPRMCPGRKLAEEIFKAAMVYLAKQELQVTCDPRFKDMASEASPWTNKDFVTRLKPGLQLLATVTKTEAEDRLKLR